MLTGVSPALRNRWDKQDIADQYYQKAQNYRNLYYPEHGFMWTKDAKGNWRDRFVLRNGRPFHRRKFLALDLECVS